MKSSIIIGGKSDEHERHENDLYNTPQECTFALIDFLDSTPHLIPRFANIWESCCGNEYIMNALAIKGYLNQIGTDIQLGVDFLRSEKRADVIITNPPFLLSVEVIERSMQLEVSVLCLLLKSQFFHASRRLELFRFYPQAYVLPLTWRPVLCPTRGKQPTMEFSWFVWIKGNHDTRYIPLEKPVIEKQNKLF